MTQCRSVIDDSNTKVTQYRSDSDDSYTRMTKHYTYTKWCIVVRLTQLSHIWCPHQSLKILSSYPTPVLVSSK